MEKLVLDTIWAKRIMALNAPVTLLVVGPAGSGKHIVLKALAGKILGDGNPAHPDLLVLPDTPTVGIDEFREVAKNLHKTGFYTSGKVFFAPDIDRLTPEAQAAFLKLLEEPPGKVSYLLSASNPDSLIQTIVSRCLVVEAGRVDEKELAKFIGEEFAAFADGRPVFAKELYESGPEYLYEKLGQFKALDNMKLFDRIKLSREWAKEDVRLIMALLDKYQRISREIESGVLDKGSLPASLRPFFETPMKFREFSAYDLKNAEPRFLLASILLGK